MLAFVFDTVAGCLFAKLMNLFSKHKINPMVGAAGISAFRTYGNKRPFIHGGQEDGYKIYPAHWH